MASDSRRAILDTLRRAAPAPVELPDPSGVGIVYPDRSKQFQESLEGVGGGFARARDAAALRRELEALPVHAQARKIVSLAPEAGPGNAGLDALADPHEMEGIDLAILPGVFGVAENGAVWVEAGRFAHRGVFVVTQHLVLVVPADAIVNTMHEAYERIRFQGAGFGVFISGPSKTADIEQALVIGAHGARSCTVFLLG